MQLTTSKLMRTHLLMLASLLLISVSSQASEKLSVQAGRPILLDGKCPAEEWGAARTVELSKHYVLKVQKTGDFLEICIIPPRPSLFMAELYIAPIGSKVYALHSSAKLGERALNGKTWQAWSEDGPWWNATGWWASTMRATGREDAPFLPSEAIEYQLDRTRFSGKQLLMMLDISMGSVLYPDYADNRDPTTWVELDLSD